MSASESAPHPLEYILFFQKGFSPRAPEQMAGTGPGDGEEKETGDAWALDSVNKLLTQRVETDYSSEPSGEAFSADHLLISPSMEFCMQVNHCFMSGEEELQNIWFKLIHFQ